MLMKKQRASDLLESLTCDPDCEKIVITSRLLNGKNGDLDNNDDEKAKRFKVCQWKEWRSG